MRRATKISTVLFVVSIFVTLSGMALSQTKMMSAMDKTFAKKAAQGGMAEVKLGELAAKQGTSDKVKQFGQRMVDDHSKANDDLKQIAANKAIALPADVDAKSKALYAKLARLHGAAFDSAYLKAMREDHAKDISEFKKEAANGRDPDIKGFASKMLPTIEEHYRMLRDTNGNMSSH